MRRSARPLLLTAVLLASAAPATAQSLAERVAGVQRGTIRFSYPTPPDVCGDGESIIRFREPGADGTRDIAIMRHRGSSQRYQGLSEAEARARCRFGPAHVTVTLAEGRAERVAVRVGEPAPGPATDLGAVPAGQAVAWLLGPAARQVTERGGEAVFAATLADADWAPAMIALATDRDVRTSTRRDAIFWVSQAAGEKAARGLRSILGDDSEEIELRKHAVFALSQQGTADAVTTLLELARNSPEPELRKAAFFWLGQRDEDPRVMALFRSILLEES